MATFGLLLGLLGTKIVQDTLYLVPLVVGHPFPFRAPANLAA